MPSVGDLYGDANDQKDRAVTEEGSIAKKERSGSDGDSLILRQQSMSSLTKEDKGEILQQVALESGALHPMHVMPEFTETKKQNLEDITAFLDMKQHFFIMFTPSRVGVALILVVISILGVFMMDPKEFRIKKSISNVKDLAGCTQLCERTLSDDKMAKEIGGEGICETVDFKYCNINSKLKVTDCTKTSNMTMAAEFDSTRCRFYVAPDVWKPYVTVCVLAVAIVCCFQNGPPDVLLMGGGAILCAVGVMDRKDFFSGLANSGVIGLGMLMPISAAISESGLLEKVVGVMLGQPANLSIALFRMMFPVALMSACLSNTATVVMLIPIIVSWARRLQVHPGKMLMPLSFAAQLGGSMTLLGSSHCLVAANAVPADIYEMGFFDLAPIGTLLMIVTTLIIWFVSTKTNLLQSSAAAAGDGPTDMKFVYDFKVRVVGGGLINSTIESAGLERMQGVASVFLMAGAEDGTMPAQSTLLQQGDVLSAQVTSRGVVEMRAHPGLQLLNQKALSSLGRARHRRFLYEVDVHPESEIATNGLPSDEELREKLGACYVAGPRRAVNESAKTTSDIVGGSVLLLEADERSLGFIKLDEWSLSFTLVHRVFKSSPQRQGLPVDSIRAAATFLGFILLIALTTVKVVKFDYGGVLLVLFYLFIRAITLDQCMKSFKVQILLTIAGAIAMGKAMESSGVVGFLAQKMIDLAEPLGVLGLTACVYIAAVFLSMFINNSATVAILAPMIIQIAEKDPDVDVQGLVWTLVYAAGTCFTTPLGYQTNLLVMPEGKYTFGDFARFGVPTQILHFVLVMASVMLLGPSLYPSFGN